jgi:hypothetical protein
LALLAANRTCKSWISTASRGSAESTRLSSMSAPRSPGAAARYSTSATS